MRERLIFTFLVHLLGIIFLLVPNRFQGTVVTSVYDIPLRVLDTVAIVMIFAASMYLYSYLFVCLKAQLKEVQKLPPDEKNDEKK
ncbi:MAG: hypothetical protein CVU89_08805 [Firmicutes bacterium HGW-Firmicutes-14]|nr:MAG: hypothetical protein CVU89_08805 [Firmicutes bacterium HGW-Firmicutes-14]